MTATDVVTRVAPLGLRFWDDVSAEVVRHGLSVSAMPEAKAGRASALRVNGSGVWVAGSLPGMQRFEHGDGSRDYWASIEAGTDPRLGARQPFLVDVSDPLGRFVAVRLRLLLPVRGVYAWPPPGLPVDARPLVAGAPPGAVPLFSASTRAVAGLAVVRAELADVSTEAPAAHALVEVSCEGQLCGRAVAGADGRVAVAFPYPELPSTSFTSPFESPLAGSASTEWGWNIELRVRWARPAAGAAAPPRLDHVFAQPLATVLARQSPDEVLGTSVLAYRENLVLRSEDSVEGRLSISTP